MKKAILWLCWGEKFIRDAAESARSAAAIESGHFLITETDGAGFAGCFTEFDSVIPMLPVHETISKARPHVFCCCKCAKTASRGLAEEAHLREPEKFAQVWHMLRKGSIVAAGEGNRNATSEARDAGRLVLAGWARRKKSVRTAARAARKRVKQRILQVRCQRVLIREPKDLDVRADLPKKKNLIRNRPTFAPQARPTAPQRLGGTFAPPKGFVRETIVRAAMANEPKRQEPETPVPVPEIEPDRTVPEIPPDKDAPEKKCPTQAGQR